MCYGTAEKIVTLYKMTSPLNAAHQNLPFPPNRTLALKMRFIRRIKFA